MKVADLTGAELDYGRVLSRAGSSKEGRAVWRIRCGCGAELDATSKQLGGRHTPCPQCRPVSRYDSLLTRVMKNIEMIPGPGCWIWMGKLNEHGYGIAKDNGVESRVHRLVYFFLHPDADRSLNVCHSCDTPSCCNPYHLFLGTQAENMSDMHSKGRFRGGAKPGNQNAVGNTGWKRGGIVKMLGRVSKFDDEVCA